MGKIKVAFFSDLLVQNFDGATRTMFQIINRIPKDEFEYLFICGMPPEGDIGFEVIKVPTISIPGNNSYGIANTFFSKKMLRKKLDDFKPDIIQFASPSLLSLFANKYGASNNIPIISIYHTHFYSYVQYYWGFVPFLIPYISKLTAYLTKTIYDKVDTLYVPTDEIKKQLLEKCKLEGSNIKIWARGMNQNKFNPNLRDSALIKEHTKNNKANILFASRIVMEKNLDLLVNLYNYCQENGNEYNFIITGDGNALKKLEKKMPNAFFLGGKKQSELAKIYASCDVFLFPSISETFGNVITEAMASGIPCVLANQGGHISYAPNNERAILCPPDNEVAFYTAIKKVLADKELSKTITTNALNFTKTLDWEKLVDSYFIELRQLVAK